jgi:acyl-CoA thioesterase-1
MVSVPVESLTLLKTCSTEIIEEEADAGAASFGRLTAGSNMSALSENLRSDFTKLARAAAAGLVKPLGALLLAVFAAAPLLAQAQAPAAAAARDTVLIVGDSLSAEYGLKRGTGWVPLLEKQLAAEKKSVRVVNASISGDTTSGGRSRLPALLRQHKPSVVVIELGGNDALRGLPLDMTEANLLTMTQAAKKAGARVLLLGMQVPPNYGGAYGATFSGLFSKVAKAEKVALVPFFLKGIADVEDATVNFQSDRIHPNEQAQTRMLANVWPALKKLLQ